MTWTPADERRVLASLAPDQVSAVRKARQRAGELIGERGWVQGREWSEDGGLCISGALYAAAWELERAAWAEGVCMTTSIDCSGSGVAEFAKRVTCMELGLVWTPNGPCPLRTWNDQPGQRLEEVLAALAGPIEVERRFCLLVALAASGSMQVRRP